MRSFLRILLTLTGLFCLTGTQPCRTPPENVMIIRGLAVFAAQPYRSFLKIFSCGVALFPESSARDPLFFKNPQQLSRSFSGIFSSWTFSGNLWIEPDAHSVGGYRGGCRPHTPTRGVHILTGGQAVSQHRARYREDLQRDQIPTGSSGYPSGHRQKPLRSGQQQDTRWYR